MKITSAIAMPVLLAALAAAAPLKTREAEPPSVDASNGSGLWWKRNAEAPSVDASNGSGLWWKRNAEAKAKAEPPSVDASNGSGLWWKREVGSVYLGLEPAQGMNMEIFDASMRWPGRLATGNKQSWVALSIEIE
ncbi:uncharacterized protein BDZ99DRAFT_555734 [Mytilinidion resinicola]|uniref:Concanavalin A-like lectin/glucanase n=1 Tax=Mytilinidion resinicola TaxID=574789 RepID=A0A6A6YY23_9PEZI|nr:uncharacterized protein BDZ99DRAFT_555734 [Mytilinidion resinicola]KAF2812837.1 hypothetical protein BDZ99DRAFT_555734 [Mytilinidion resinicola]